MEKLPQRSQNSKLYIVQLEEESGRKSLEKPQEIDEACFSLDEPEQEDGKVQLTVDDDFTNSVAATVSVSHQFHRLEMTEDDVIYKRDKASESVNNSLNPHGMAEVPCLTADCSTNHQMQTEIHGPSCGENDGDKRAESMLPDFNRLLSSEADPEENAKFLQEKCRELIAAGLKSAKIFDELKKIGLIGDIPEDGSLDVALDGLDESISWTEDECLGIVEMMRMASQCNDPFCAFMKCQLGQKMISDVEADLKSLESVLPLATRRLLDAIIKHSSVCDELQCSVPWCSCFYQCRDAESEEQCAALQGRYRKRQFAEDFAEINIEIPETSEFIELERDVIWPFKELKKLQRTVLRGEMEFSIPRNGIDFLVDGHFGQYGQLGLTALSTTLPPIQLNIIQYISFDDSKTLWKSLHGLRHENIVRHLWSCVDNDSNNVTVCRDHFCTDTESLESLVNKVKPRTIFTSDALGYVAGLLSAVRYLNDHNIYYLKWSASGIQMNYDYKLAQLGDFSLAINASVIEEDDEMISVVANSLPPNVLPPEMFCTDESDGNIGDFTEIWGIGCIIYHVSCGQPVHYKLRHEPLESVRETVKNFVPKDHVKLVKHNHMKQILTRIFTEQENRIDFEQLESLLQTILALTTP